MQVKIRHKHRETFFPPLHKQGGVARDSCELTIRPRNAYVFMAQSPPPVRAILLLSALKETPVFHMLGLPNP